MTDKETEPEEKTSPSIPSPIQKKPSETPQEKESPATLSEEELPSEQSESQEKEPSPQEKESFKEESPATLSEEELPLERNESQEKEPSPQEKESFKEESPATPSEGKLPLERNESQEKEPSPQGKESFKEESPATPSEGKLPLERNESQEKEPSLQEKESFKEESPATLSEEELPSEQGESQEKEPSPQEKESLKEESPATLSEETPYSTENTILSSQKEKSSEEKSFANSDPQQEEKEEYSVSEMSQDLPENPQGSSSGGETKPNSNEEEEEENEKEGKNIPPIVDEHMDKRREEIASLIDFDLMDTEGRWLLKVISGPNTGAEFSLHAGTSYTIGSDAKTCDIIFQDMSVSRKHAKLVLDQKNNLSIEDLDSKNGIYVDGKKETAVGIHGNASVSLGTTTFLLLDREAEQTTIVAKTVSEPVMQAAKESLDVMQGPPPDLSKIQTAVLPPMQSEVDKVKQSEKTVLKNAHSLSSLVILSLVTGLLMIAGVGATFLFRTEEITTPSVAHPDKEITGALANFPTIRYSYNPVNHRLLLVGHLLTPTDRSRMLDELQTLSFISEVDYNNVVIDELVWKDFNQILSKNPAWKGITITSPSAGRFILSGFLQTKKQEKELSDYVSQNFPYLELLEKKVIVEEDLLGQVKRELVKGGFRGVTPSISSGDLILNGSIPKDSQEDFANLCALFKALPGIHSIQTNVSESGKIESVVDLTGKYLVTGFSKHGSQMSVVIGGHFLSSGDMFEGMRIIDITESTVYLEKDGVKYKIDFNHY